MKPSVVRSFVLAAATALVVLSGCTVSALDGGNPSNGPNGALGDTCSCGNGQPDCDANQSQCQQGLVCLKGDTGVQTCTRQCGIAVVGACPANYICKAANVPGARLACFKQ
jgi:hypothetical protein